MPSSLTKEGGAHERDGSFDIIAYYFCSSVLHRQRAACFSSGSFLHFYCVLRHIQKYIAVSWLIQHLLQATHQNFVRQFLLGMYFLYSQYPNECLH